MGAVPMVTMAQKRRELAHHAHSRGSHAFTHTLTSTQSQPRCCAKRQLSYYRIWDRIIILKVPEGGAANRSTRRKLPTSCLLIGITYPKRQSNVPIEPSPSNIGDSLTWPTEVWHLFGKTKSHNSDNNAWKPHNENVWKTYNNDNTGKP